MLTGTETVVLFPAKSTALPETIWFNPSVVSVKGAEQEATPEVWSVQEKLNVTLDLFHPYWFGKGFCAYAMLGGSVSTPITVIVTFAPGLLLNSTETVLLSCRLTDFWRVATLGLKFEGPNTWTPLRDITALATPLF